jgi:LuxR family glucitol operon transcriptional activator
MAFALFPKMPSRSAVSYVAGLETDRIAAEEALSQLQRLSLIREFQDRFRMLPLTREYALAELGRHTDFESEARERWVDWYLRFAERYGGHDMREWHVGFDSIEGEWENLLAVFDWCADQKRYDVIKAFWCAEETTSTIDFTSIYGLWDDREHWLSWLMETAGARGDWLTYLDAQASHAYTLTLMSRYDEAEAMFKQGQTVLPHHAEPQTATRFLINYAYLQIFKRRFEEVDRLLDLAAEAAQKVPEPLSTRFMLTIDYNRAASSFWQGDTVSARAGFTGVMHRGNDFGRQRIANYAQNYLADIAIREEDYNEAERLLGAGLTMAERNNERRRTSSYKRSFASLTQKQGKWDDAIRWAKEARDGYEQLGAEKEIQEMDQLIQELRMKLRS